MYGFTLEVVEQSFDELCPSNFIINSVVDFMVDIGSSGLDFLRMIMIFALSLFELFHVCVC